MPCGKMSLLPLAVAASKEALVNHHRFLFSPNLPCLGKHP
jgi:hypothetical protein